MISRRLLQHAGAELNTLRATRSGSLLMGALALALGACSAGDEADGMPTYGNVPAFNNNGAQNNGTVQNPATNGSTSNVSNTGTQSTSNSNGSNSSGSNTGSNTGSQATPPAQQNNGSQPSGSQTGSAQEGNPSGAPITNGNTNGAANGGTNTGSNTGTNTGNTGGSGGMMAPGGGGNTGMPPANNGNQNPPPDNNGNQNPPPPATPDITCPSGASFCSGFESSTLPSGSVFQPTGTQPQFDTAIKHSGNQSIVFPAGAGGFSVKEVVTPIPGQTFWARLFVQVSSTFGDNDHDSLFVASTATTAEDNNAEHGPELSEQGNQILLNADDALFNANGPGFPSNGAAGPTISANTWHCIEAFYNGGTGDVQIFNDGTMVINAPAYKKLTYSTFRFGYIQFNTARTIHFDDVVVAADRVGCN